MGRSKGRIPGCTGRGYSIPVIGKPGLSVETMPEPDHPVQDGYIGYHLRTGAHDITKWDWEQYIKFVDNHIK